MLANVSHSPCSRKNLYIQVAYECKAEKKDVKNAAEEINYEYFFIFFFIFIFTSIYLFIYLFIFFFLNDGYLIVFMMEFKNRIYVGFLHM